MQNFLKTRVHAFRHAIDGWFYVIRTQRNAWIHATFSISVLILGGWLHLSRQEWVDIVLVIALVWLAEFLNTALEAVVDLASPEHHDLAKIGKDVGAAAVLIAAGTSVVVGLLTLGPHLISRIERLF